MRFRRRDANLCRGDNRGGGLLDNWDGLRDNWLLNSWGGLSRSCGLFLGGFGRLVSGLLSLLALDGSTELGEWRLWLLDLLIAGGWLLLLGQPWERAGGLASLGGRGLSNLGLAIGDGSLGGLSCDRSLAGLDRRNDGSILAHWLSILGRNNWGLSGRLLLLSEGILEGSKDAVALCRNRLGLSWGSDSGLGSWGGFGFSGGRLWSGNDGLSCDRLNWSGGFLSGSSNWGLLLGDLWLLFLLSKTEATEDGVALAGCASALTGLLLLFLDLLLFFLLLLFGLSLFFLLLFLLLFLNVNALLWDGSSNDGWLSQLAEALLVGLALGNAGCKLLSLRNLFLQDGKPVVTLWEGVSLEGVLVSSKVEGEVDGSIWSEFGNFGLERDTVST